MSKQKDKGSGLLLLLGILFFALIYLVSFSMVVLPIVLLIGYFYYSFKSNTIKKTIHGEMSDFWLSENEKDNFKTLSYQLEETSEIIQAYKQKGIVAELSINKDGSFSQRSKLGKEIHSILTTYEPIKLDIQSQLLILSYKPYNEWINFNKYLVNAKSNLYALITWLVILMLYQFTSNQTHSKIDIFSPYLILAKNLFSGNIQNFSFSSFEAKVIIAASVSSLLMFILIKLVAKFRKPALKYSPEPDIVSLTNIDMC